MPSYCNFYDSLPEVPLSPYPAPDSTQTGLQARRAGRLAQGCVRAGLQAGGPRRAVQRGTAHRGERGMGLGVAAGCARYCHVCMPGLKALDRPPAAYTLTGRVPPRAPQRQPLSRSNLETFRVARRSRERASRFPV